MTNTNSAKAGRPRKMARDPAATQTQTKVGGNGQPDGTAQGEPKEPPTRQPTKIDQVIALLQLEQGATLAEIEAATGWQPHTIRAALTGLRKKGHTIERGKRDDVTCYHANPAN